MSKKNPIKKKLEKILALKDAECPPEKFEEGLHLLSSSDDFDSLDLNDKEALAMLFFAIGEKQLEEGNRKFLDNFSSAEKIAPHSYELFFKKGRSLSKYPTNAQCLVLAKKAYKKATFLNPKSFHAHYELGTVLVQQGLHMEESSFFQEALSQFEEADFLLCESEHKSIFYWQFGRAWFYLGKLSGEAMDFHKAIEKYRKSSKDNLTSALFWNDYGDAMIEMAFLLGKKEYFFEAVELYQTALVQDEECFQTYFNLGAAYQCVFEITLDPDYFKRADECFEKAAKIEFLSKTPSATLWFKWGQLLADFGKLTRDTSYLQQSFEKFNEADSLEPDHPGILSRFGEAEMLLGANTDDVFLLRQAEAKFIRSLQLCKEAPENWYFYGICLNELGRYFTDVGFYEEAIQKFQYGLSLTQTDPLLWYGLAMSYFTIGEMENNREMLEKACLHCGRVAELGGQIFLQFWNDWAVILMRLSEMTLDESYLEAALEKFEQILKRENRKEDSFEENKKEPFDAQELSEEIDLEWLYNYGCALDMYGDFTDGETYYGQAVQVLSYVVKLDPDYTHARYNLALALSHLGEMISDVDCLQKASQHFEILVSGNPEDECAWNDWGLLLLHQGELVHESCRPDQSQQIYEQAEKNFFHALSLGCLPAYYNLACLYAMRQNFEAAMHHMEKAELHHCLPPLDTILHDEWLEPLRAYPSFKAFIADLSNKEKK
ncbi:MAG TPA: hypothetical protein PLC42_06145 [Parachlamydiaceae bacterium]|nr:hypothetical protein [Parachlamydiaceae bacterium]